MGGAKYADPAGQDRCISCAGSDSLAVMKSAACAPLLHTSPAKREDRSTLGFFLGLNAHPPVDQEEDTRGE